MAGLRGAAHQHAARHHHFGIIIGEKRPVERRPDNKQSKECPQHFNYCPSRNCDRRQRDIAGRKPRPSASVIIITGGGRPNQK